MMKTVLLDVYNETAQVIEIEDELDAFYDKLQCSCIDIVQRTIGGKPFLVMCDDEGLFKEEYKLSAISDMGDCMFVGNLMFFHDGGNGELAGLSDDDIKHILKRIIIVYTSRYLDGYPMLTQCEY